MNNEASVRDNLIEAGKKEFLARGYEKASLRKISKAANVSTGAIYFFFQNKEEFFKSIVGETARCLKALILKLTEAEINGEKTSAESEREVIEFIYENKEEAAILLKRAENSPYEGFKAELCALLEKGYLRFYENYGGRKEDADIAKIIAKMRIQGHIELIDGGYDLDTALKYSRMLATYGDSGFLGLMEQYNGKGSV